MVLAAIACEKKNPTPAPDPVDPVFPDLVVKTVAAGQSVSVPFSANMDWKITIPTAMTRYFYIDNNGSKDYNLKGGEGSHTVKICAEAVEVFEPVSCTIVMAMGKQTKDFIKITLSAKERSLLIYAAKKDADGHFVQTETGDYEYEDKASSSLLMTWPDGLAGYVLPVKVEANFKWSIDPNHPEWFESSATSAESGTSFLVFKGVADKLPLEDASSRIYFQDLSAGNQPVSDLQIGIKGCKDILYVNCPETIELNVLGQYIQNSTVYPNGCPVVVSAAEGAGFVIFGNDGGMLSTSEGQWLRAKRDDSGSSSNVIKDMHYMIVAEQNSSAERSALVLVLPAYMMEKGDFDALLLSADRKSVKDEYRKYVVANAVQMGKESKGMVYPLNTAYNMGVKGAAFWRSTDKDEHYSMLKAQYGTEEIYTVMYNSMYSYENVLLACDTEFDSVAYLDLPIEGAEEYPYDDYVSVTTPDSSNPKSFVPELMWFMDGQDVAVILRKESNVLALVVVRMDYGFWPEIKYDDICFMMTGGLTTENGAELVKLSSGDFYNKFAEYGIPVYQLSYEETGSILNAMFYVPPFPMDSPSSIVIPELDKQWLSAEAAISENDKTYLQVRMKPEHPECGPNGEIVLWGGGRRLFALQCVRKFVK